MHAMTFLPKADLTSESLEQMKAEQGKLDKALTPLLDRIEKLERVAEAARSYLDATGELDQHLERHDCEGFSCDHRDELKDKSLKAEKALEQALAALDGKEA